MQAGQGSSNQITKRTEHPSELFEVSRPYAHPAENAPTASWATELHLSGRQEGQSLRAHAFQQPTYLEGGCIGPATVSSPAHSPFRSTSPEQSRTRERSEGLVGVGGGVWSVSL